MITKITRSKGFIALIIDDISLPLEERPVLAAMTLYEGTGCWQLTDIRLSRSKTPSPYSGSPDADTLCATYKPNSAQEVDYIKSRLREYTEYEGSILWCSFDGIVRGHATVNDYAPVRWANFDQAGYFSQAEGVEKLQEIKGYWDNVESLDANWRIENTNRQPTLSDIQHKLIMIKNGHLNFTAGQDNQQDNQQANQERPSPSKRTM